MLLVPFFLTESVPIAINLTRSEPFFLEKLCDMNVRESKIDRYGEREREREREKARKKDKKKERERESR